MIRCIIFGVLTGLILGTSLGLFIAVHIGFEGIKFGITTVLIAIAVGTFFAFMYHVNDVANDYVWNNGICTECEGKMEFTSASHTKYNNRYYYKCNDCGNVIELDHLYN